MSLLKKLFQRAKLQKNESQSQQIKNICTTSINCFKEQNYKKMKANHNPIVQIPIPFVTVSKSKITKK